MKRFGLILCLAGCLIFTGCLEGKEAIYEKQFKAKDPEIRRKAAIELGNIATAEALRLLELQRDDKNFRVKEAVRKSIAKINARTFLR